MSLADYCDQLAAFAMGVLHWSERDALSADMNAILLARDAQWEFTLDVLEVGGFIERKADPGAPAAKPAPESSTQSLTPALFKALFANKR